MFIPRRNTVLSLVSISLPLGILVGALGWSTLVWASTGDPSAASSITAAGAQARPGSPCRLPLVTTITATGQRCEPVDVSVQITIACPSSLPLHLVVVMDRSLAMKDNLRQAKQAARRAIATLDLSAGSKVSVLSHGEAARIESSWTGDPIVAEGAVNGVTYRAGDSGSNPGAALTAAFELLSEASDRNDALESVLLIGAGCPTTDSTCAASVRQGAALVAGTGAATIAICFESDLGDCRPYRDAASSSRVYLDGPGYRIDRAIALVIDAGRFLMASEVFFEEYVTTSNFRYVPESGTPVPEVEEGDVGQGLKQILRFTWKDRARNTSVVASYQLRAVSEESGGGAIRGTGGLSRIGLIDSLGRSMDVSIEENPQVPIRPRCGVETATPTALPTATSTSTEEPTIAPAPSETATEAPATSTRPMPTSIPAQVYIPLLLREHCTPTLRRMDVSLIIDASSSMSDRTAAGRSKIEAAVAAAKQLLGELAFSAGDQAGLVVFNETVTVDVPVTADRAILEAALANIRTAPGTCIPCSVEVGLRQLDDAGADRTRTRVMVLLTDGQSNLRPIEDAIAETDAAKRDGVEIFAVGLGTTVAEAALLQMVSRPEYFYRTSDAEALAEIFASIMTEIPCPASSFWGRR